MTQSKGTGSAAVLSITILISVCFGEGPTEQQLRERQRNQAGIQRQISEFKKDLPDGYTVDVKLKDMYSDDAAGMVKHLVALTPLNSKGKPDGVAHVFGSTIREVPYRNGTKDGTEKAYAYHNRKKVLSEEIPWSEGKIDGIKKAYHPNGKLRAQVPYENGERHGESKEFDFNGRLVKQTPYKGGKRNGEMVEYWTLTGEKMRVVPYKNGKIHGLVQEFYDHGQLKKEVTAVEDSFHGTEKQYDEEGTLIKRRYWLDDDPVSEAKFKNANR